MTRTLASIFMEKIAASDSQQSHPSYRPDIDGLRAIAVLSVLIYHAVPAALPSGFIGVDIFFVISGYLISSIIIKGTVLGTFSIAGFYARRIKRIIPALLLVLGSCLVFGWFALLADEYNQIGKHVVAGIGFVSNFMLWSESGYFDVEAESKPLLHLWSLGIEEQFYIVWPVLIASFFRYKLPIIILIIILLLLSFAGNITVVNSDATAVFYSPLTRFWELLVGCLLAYLVVSRQNRFQLISPKICNALSVLGMLLLIIALITITNEKPFPGYWAVLPVSGAALLIASGAKSWVNKSILSSKILVWVGLISFPLYLWHWPLLSFANIIQGGTPSLVLRCLLMTIAVALAWVTYRFVEQPIRSGKSRWFGVRALLGMMLGLGVAGYVVASMDGFQNRAAVQNSDFTSAVSSQFMGPLWKYTSNDECLTSYPFKDAEEYQWWFCMKSSQESPTIAILGNSYANQLYPGFVVNPLLSHHTILSIGTCDSARNGDNKMDPARPCFGGRRAQQASFIDDIVLNTPSLQYVIFGGLMQSPDEAYIARLKRRIDQFEQAGKTVIVFNAHLRPVENPKSCFSKPFQPEAKNCSIPYAKRDALDEAFKPLIDSLAQSNPNVLFFDQNDVFCENGVCFGVKEGMPLHRDPRHTSEFASIELQQYFSLWAKTQIPQLLVR